MTSKFLLAPVAVAAALCFGAVSAQTTTTAPATSSGSMAAGSSAPRSQTGPMASDKTTDKTADKAAKKDDKLARGDRKFIEDALSQSQFEIQAGQLAATKATDPAIKAYGEQMVKDHTAASQALQQIASKHQIEQPKELSRGQKRHLSELQKKTGDAFDKEFVHEVAMDAHKDDVKKFEKAAKDVKDPELKAWVDKTLPTVKQHHTAALQLPQGKADATKMGGPATRDKPAAPAAGAPKS